MKIGNLHSEFLDDFLNNFTQNYVKAAAAGMRLDAQSISQPEYDDFLDKYARSRAQEATKQGIREQIFKFVNTEANRDNHLCELILRKASGKHKIKLTHYSGSFDYAAFQAIWHFNKSEEKLAGKIFDTLAFTLDGINKEHNSSQKHSVALAPMIREAVKPIAESHQYRKNAVALDESDLQSGESNWEQTLYGNKYPPFQEESKQQMFNSSHNEGSVKRTMYTGRNSKTTKEI